MKQLLKGIIIFLLSIPCYSAVFNLPVKGNIVGEVQNYTVQPQDTFASIAEKFNVTYTGLMEANPYIVPKKLQAGTSLVIPGALILPNVERKGIVINLAELRLYYYPPKQKIVYSFPVGIGMEGWNITPGKMKIVEKKKDPTWYVPVAVHKELAARGYHIPFVIPPGPDNPLGGYMLRLSQRTFLIHGVVDPTTVGRRSSSGCFRMYPEDIVTLFNMVPIGTPVQVINQAYKVGLKNGQLLVEAHIPLEEQQNLATNYTPLIEQVNNFIGNKYAEVDWDQAFSLIEEANGMPTSIGFIA